jgi:hypothetical protein
LPHSERRLASLIGSVSTTKDEVSPTGFLAR